jgi:sulfoxide reductase heme-binding subunit YedZ
MAQTTKKPSPKITQTGIIILVIIVAMLAITTIIYALTPSNTVYNWLIRLFGLYGFIFLSLASIMSPFLTVLYKIFGKPFLKLHHFCAIAGLALITLHPILLAIERNSFLVFLPNFDSVLMFWTLAGRPSLILIYIALIGVLFKKKLKYWRGTHALMYIALLMGYVHGVLIGTDFQNPVIVVLFSILFGLTVVAMVWRRYQLFMQSKKKKAQSSK